MQRSRIYTMMLTVVVTASTFWLPDTASAGAPSTVSPNDVVSMNRVGDVITATTWTPAPGVSPQELRAKLSARGVTGIVDESASDHPFAAEEVDCSIEGAYALQRLCGINQIHWSGSHPVVYFIDSTSDSWPAYSAAFVWNYSTALDVGYRWWTQGCPGSHCVNIGDYDYGPTGWSGNTSYSFNVSTREFLDDGSVWISLNDYYTYNEDGFMQTACHEMGHALGLAHNTYLAGGSCLWYQTLNSGHRNPASGDYQVLEQIY